MVFIPTSFFVSNIFDGLIWFLLPCALVIINDIGAYLVGARGRVKPSSCSLGLPLGLWLSFVWNPECGARSRLHESSKPGDHGSERYVGTQHEWSCVATGKLSSTSTLQHALI